VYASQASSPWIRLIALVNWRLSHGLYAQVYPKVGRVIAVCEEDRSLTLAVAPTARVEVIENGVDCQYFSPNRARRLGPVRLLFTGTSSRRNVVALRQFVQRIYPSVRARLPGVELLVAGNFTPEAQGLFRGVPSLRFTGPVDDIRPFFNECDIFVAPFQAAHGSKLKIAQAMAMGMPIVSTARGVRGFELLDGQSVLVAQSDQEFAGKIVTLAQDSEQREQLSKAAREVALATLDWPVLGRRLRAIVGAVYQELSREREAMAGQGPGMSRDPVSGKLT